MDKNTYSTAFFGQCLRCLRQWWCLKWWLHRESFDLLISGGRSLSASLFLSVLVSSVWNPGRSDTFALNSSLSLLARAASFHWAFLRSVNFSSSSFCKIKISNRQARKPTCIGTGIRGKSVPYQSSFVIITRSSWPNVIASPPPERGSTSSSSSWKKLASKTNYTIQQQTK